MVLPDIKYRKIAVSEMAPHVHSFDVNENKTEKISRWLEKWIREGVKAGRIKPYDMLPSKGDLAFHIGVSIGTMQNVFRHIEDCGLVESKQRIGTYIKPFVKNCAAVKLTSKRELAVQMIKNFLVQNNYKPGDKLISSRRLSKITGISNATVRNAIECLISEKIIDKKDNIYTVVRTDFIPGAVKQLTLAEKIADKINQYIETDFQKGDKLPANSEFAKQFNVSVKTIHDSMKLLEKKGILIARRGRYGTTVAGQDMKAELYNYEKIELKIRHYIAENCEIGSKLPSIEKFSSIYNISCKTVKKALNNLAEDGYLTFVRGRYGGTFVTDIPQSVNEAYRWLAISSDYISNT